MRGLSVSGCGPARSTTLSGACGPIAQRLEQGTHNPLVPGSNPGGPTIRWTCRRRAGRYRQPRALGVLQDWHLRAVQQKSNRRPRQRGTCCKVSTRWIRRAYGSRRRCSLLLAARYAAEIGRLAMSSVGRRIQCAVQRMATLLLPTRPSPLGLAQSTSPAFCGCALSQHVLLAGRTSHPSAHSVDSGERPLALVGAPTASDWTRGFFFTPRPCASRSVMAPLSCRLLGAGQPGWKWRQLLEACEHVESGDCPHPPGSRLTDVIGMAGGLGSEGDLYKSVSIGLPSGTNMR